MNRTAKVLLDSTSKVLTMAGTDPPDLSRRTLLSFKTASDLSLYVLGSDAEIGGTTTSNLDLSGPDGTARFYGNLSMKVQPGWEKKLQHGGYAGFRNAKQTTLFGEMSEDLTFHEYMVLRVRGAGDPRTRHGWWVNLMTTDSYHDDLYQHKLVTLRNDGGWEDVYLPLDRFQLTYEGQPVPNMKLDDRRAVIMVGISILSNRGTHRGIEGVFELGLDSVAVTNDAPEAVKKEHQRLNEEDEEREFEA